MRILIANYRYFVSGGPERYMFNLSAALDARGHQVIPFSIRYARNQRTPYAPYFAKPLAGEDEVYFRDQQLNPATALRTLRRLFYAREVEHAVRRLATDTRPHVAYVLHYLRKLSPALLVGIKASGIPVVVRLSDFAMLCPEAHCLRLDTPCTACTKGALWPSVYHGCVQGSRVASLLNALATCYHRFCHYFGLVDVFVTTTRFMHRMMLSAGFPEQRLQHIPTFVDASIFRPPPTKGDYLVFVGRLERTKGIHVLLDAFSLLRRSDHLPDIRLKIVGSGSKPYVQQLRHQTSALALDQAVDFVGPLEAAAVAEVLGGALLSVQPSLWFENLPNAVLESYACATPVLASDLGSLPECVFPGETGDLFRAGDAMELANRMQYWLARPRELAYMSGMARHAAETLYSADRHVAALEQLFTQLTEGH